MQGDRPYEQQRGPEGPPKTTQPGAGGPPASQPAPGPPVEKKEPAESEWQKADRKRRKALLVRIGIGLVLLILFVIFVSLNSDSVRVRFIFFETRTPLVWVFLICALIGGLVAFLLGRTGRRASRKYIKELERRLEERGGKSD